MMNHQTHRDTSRWCLLIAFLATFVFVLPERLSGAGMDAQAADREARQALEALRRAARGDLEAIPARETGSYSFVRAKAGAVLAADNAAATPENRALAFLAAYGGLVGLNEAERSSLLPRGPAIQPLKAIAGSELRVAKVERDELGGVHVRMSQFYQGLPVFGGELVVHMNARGITAVNGYFIPDIAVSREPKVGEAAAAEIALEVLREALPERQLKIGEIELNIYRIGLLEGFPGENILAYAVEVSAEPNIREQVWINAHTGAFLNRISLNPDALFRVIYSPAFMPNNPDLFVVRKEGDPPTLVPPFDNLYDFAGHTYNLFFGGFGRDSYDGAGAKMRSVYLVNQICPNAFWNGTTTNYCPGFDLDDVVAHEWGHAYTQFTHNLIYQFQSGALNESYSDIWGEIVDLSNGVDGIGGNNNSQPFPNGQRWLVGEDLGQQAQELILRDMWNPERLGDPAKVSSGRYACGTGDNGGVHTNSGVPNHAFAMLVDGKTFNGQTVGSIGAVKASHIYYRAMRVYQTRTTNFAGHDQALKQSCQDLVGQNLKSLFSGTPSGQIIAQSDCDQVAKAMLAVEMSTPPTQCNYKPLLAKDAPAACGGSATIFSENWEAGLGSWTRTSTGVNPEWPNYNWQARGALPEGRAGSAAFAFNDPGGTCAPGGDISGQFTLDSPEVSVPAGASSLQLRFDHFVETELNFDGGNIKVSVNGGPYNLVPQSAYLFNAPGSRLNDPPPVGNNTNPKAAEFAWHGTDGGTTTGSWGTTIVDLSSLAKPGDRIRIRFDFGVDGCNGITGWFLDNVRLYSCPVLAPPTNLATGSDYENPDTDGSFTLSWTRPGDATGPDTVQESTTACSAILFDNAEGGLANWNLSREGVGTFDWETSTAKPNHNSTTFRATALEGALNAASLMTLKQPIAIPSVGSTILSFLDWFVNEGDDSVKVEVSEDGQTWVTIYNQARSALAADAEIAFQTERLSARTADLTGFAGRTVHLRFRYQVGPENRAGSTPFGWYVDDIAVTNDGWTDIATVGGTSHRVTDRGTGSYCYRVRTTYTIEGQPAQSGYSNVVRVNVNRSGGPAQKADLTVTSISLSNNRARQGQKVTVSAVVSNIGTASAAASKTEFLLDGRTVIGLADTPVIPAGGSATVSVNWDTRSQQGDHVIRVTSDKTGAVDELSESNNSASRTVTIHGNKFSAGP